MGLRVAIDTGGTFTDVVGIDEASGTQWVVKTPSTPSDPSVGLLNGVRAIAEAASSSEADVSVVLHGSTVATNAVLEHKFDGLGLLVTKGFRHIIEIARQSVPDGYGNSFFWVKPPRLVPLHLVREVPGRMLHDGSEAEALDEAAALQAADELVELGVKCLAVCFLHSYANDAHEQRVAELIAAKYPDLFVSLSSVVLPEYREYERAMTTLIDVLVKPYCKTYLQHAADEIRAKAGDTPFLIMQSNGGVVTHATAGGRPVTMLLSGPAAGVLGAMHVAELAGHEDILTLDVGGTSTDVALIEKLAPQMTSYSMVEHYPVKTPMLDIATVGTGGGSLAWVDQYDNLKVGPRSAGAEPGPICYGRGGTQPTVTDAALVLGRIPETLAGGLITLDKAASQAAFDDLGKRFGMTAEEVAAGVFEIATVNQVHGIRQVTVTRGRDPRDYVLLAFGGAGGMFATDVADFLEIGKAISPPNPGNLSAFGLHVSDIKRDYVQTLVRQQSAADPKEIESVWQALEAAGKAEIADEGVAPDNIALQRSADVRYVGEGHEVPVILPVGMTGGEAIGKVWADFHEVHERTFGFSYEGRQDVEIVNLRVQAVGRVHRPKPQKVAGGSKSAAPKGARRVFWRKTGWVDCPLYDRAGLVAGQTIAGPLISEEYGSTVVVPPGWSVRSDDYGILHLEREA
ncbi:hydantoinase/oxoprolinase family protein [Microbaculum marinum]|uniref:Hydantoinase/oxoprolinase family protein n=1 Tax=Microbaculum marinum TaxID=1764581 RepID=A0AAW9RW11_9HYPH